MINVSSSFKESIKKDIREIGGIAEIIVSGGYFNATVDGETGIQISATNNAEISNLNSVTDNLPVAYNYISLEHNHTILDGSFILANRDYTNKNTGYISSTNTGSLTIEATAMSWMRFLTKGSKLITIYFEEGYATDFDVELYGYYTDGQTHEANTYSFTNNDKDIVLVDGSDIPDTINGYQFFCLSRIVITVNQWNNPDLRVKIKQVNFGESMLFQNQDLIEMKINEETSIDNMNTPNNDCSVLLNNYNRKFNLINQESVLNRLDKNAHIRTFIGVALDGGIEYVDMGSYQYNSYTENEDKTILLSGIGALQNYETKQNYLWEKGVANKTVLETLQSMLGTDNDVFYNSIIQLDKTDTENERQQLQAIAIFSGSYIKENRDINSRLENKICFRKQSYTPLDNISLLIQTKDPKITKKSKTRTVKFTHKQINSLKNEEKVIVEDTFTPINQMIDISISNIEPLDVNSIKVYEKDGLGVETEIPSSDYTIYNSYFKPRIRIMNLTSNDNIDIKIVGKEYDNTDIEKTIINDLVSEGEGVEFNSNYLSSNYDKERVSGYLFARESTYGYEFEIEFNGDPSLEVGDIITFETVDGWMKGFIEKIEMKFNGGLLETIKGVCSNVLR